MSEYDVEFLKNIIINYTGGFYDTSYEPFLKLQYDLPRDIFISLFSNEITVLQEIERLIYESTGEDLHFHVFFPKSTLLDLKNDNKLWFVIKKNKITGIVFDGCDLVKDTVWPKILRKLRKLKHLQRVNIRLPEEKISRTLRMKELPDVFEVL